MSMDNYSEYVGDAWHAMGCPSVAQLAQMELKPGEHYPDCPQSPEAAGWDIDSRYEDLPKPGDPCTCYGEGEER